jgi:hypothetical protein
MPNLNDILAAWGGAIMAFDGTRAEFYRDQARRIRAIAATCVSSDIKEQLERVANQYEALAYEVDADILATPLGAASSRSAAGAGPSRG